MLLNLEKETETKMYQGKVKWFNDQKGYGFITGDDKNDYFLHFSEIQMEGHKTLHEGDSVSFDVEATEKGNKAVKVNKI
jgi:CspA family cold shock protein